MKEYARWFYQSKEWRKTRNLFISSQLFICNRCGRPARIVHHVTPITPENIHNPDITLNWDNLEALCIECHNLEHMSSDAVAEGYTFTSAGDIIPKL